MLLKNLRDATISNFCDICRTMFKIGNYRCCVMNIFLRKKRNDFYTLLLKGSLVEVSFGVLSVIVWCDCGARLMQRAGVEASRSDGIERKTGKVFLG